MLLARSSVQGIPLLSIRSLTRRLQAARAAAISHRELIRRNNAIDSKTLKSDIDDMEKYKPLSTALLNHAILKQPGLADTFRADPDFRHLR